MNLERRLTEIASDATAHAASLWKVSKHLNATGCNANTRENAGLSDDALECAIRKPKMSSKCKPCGLKSHDLKESKRGQTHRPTESQLQGATRGDDFEAIQSTSATDPREGL